MSLNTKKAVIISGHLIHLSDNILPFLDKHTDIYCHTWKMDWNSRWLRKLIRYKKYCNDIYTEYQSPVFKEKRLSYFYSTYKAVNMIKDIDSYKTIIKFKPNVDGDISYVGDTEYYFTKAYLQSRPLLNGKLKEDCIYGTVYYKTLDERIFSGYPLAFKKMFHILEGEFITQMHNVNDFIKTKYGTNCEGSLFWEEWAYRKEVPLIQDLDLRIPNSKQWQQ
jgi:hypothetical protein